MAINRIMSVDLEYDFDSSFKSESVEEVVPKLLDLFKEYNVKATFFVVGKLINKYEDLILEIAKRHEIASHSYSHPRTDKLSYDELKNELIQSKKAIEDLNLKCYGFRAPFLKPHKNIFQALKSTGYVYDSSLSSSHPPFFANPFIKTKPYQDKVLELPAGQLFYKFVPASFFYYRFLYPFSKYVKMPYLFYLHPCELQQKLDLSNMPLWRKMFYSRNLGKKSWDILREFLNNSDSNWMSCIDYAKSQDLL